ncbi:hypothetical protein HGG75_24800 [Ochrobactrum pseudogrignonense]|nr:hypothetical protein [Brucella pseudogrignonensis]
MSCVLLARGTASTTTATAVEASSNFAALYTACGAGIAFVCRDLPDSFDPVISARGRQYPQHRTKIMRWLPFSRKAANRAPHEPTISIANLPITNIVTFCRTRSQIASKSPV